MNNPAYLPVTVLTGFLGSGKTTLLNALLRDPRLADTAVVVNELGAIGLDHLLVTQGEDNVVLLEVGCLCVGLDADLTLVALDHEREVRAAELGSYSDYSLYDGRRLKGWPRLTMVRGVVVMKDGRMLGPDGVGRYIRRTGTTQIG